MRIVQRRALAAEVKRVANRASVIGVESERAVSRIVAQVRQRGDRAVRRYAERLDGLEKRKPLQVTRAEMQQALGCLAPESRVALETAAANIRQFCEWQKPQEFRREIRPGISVGQIIRPLESVGCYVPGGRYPLPSSLLMTVIPAQVAGVKEISVASPRPAPETLAAAALLGVERFYRVGGAQAIAALAYGTESIARVQKIVGPGNRFVTAAKKLVAFDCAIDFLAGPTEVVIVSDTGVAGFIAADLLAQAEHDPDASAIFITSSQNLAQAVAAELKLTARHNPTANASLRRQGRIFLTRSAAESTSIANAIAPEHITVPGELVPEVANAGSIFVGDYSPQALGDYAAGPNHVLPTGGAARFRGGLSVMDYVKIISVQEVSREALQQIAPVVETLAALEGLQAHAESVRVRCAHA